MTMDGTSLASAAQAFAAQMAVFQTMLLAASAVHKAARWTHSLNVMRQFAGVPGALAQGRREVDCGCSFGPTSKPLGSFQIARNLVLAALAVFIAWASAFRGTAPTQGIFVLGGLALLALYGALDQVMALQPLRRGELT